MRPLTRALLVLLSIAGGLLVLTAVTSKLYRIPNPAMEPTLHCPRPAGGCLGDDPDRIAVSRILYRVRDPRRGDVVAYRISNRGAAQCGSEPGGTYVHRIVGLPGDRLAVRGGVAYVNGRRLQESYVTTDRRGGPPMPARTIPADHYVVLGDNRARSCDSRVWGYVPRNRIVGPKIATYWPLDRISVR